MKSDVEKHLRPDPGGAGMSYEGHQGNRIKMCCVGKLIWSFVSRVSLTGVPIAPKTYLRLSILSCL